MASMVYAVESWIMALIGWAWLSFQEMWAWSLLSAQVFYSLMCLATLNVVASGIAPESVGPRSAYFGAVLGLAMHATSCILDTLPMPGVFSSSFSPPANNNTMCSLHRSTQLYFFGDSVFFLAQAGATMGYLVVQLVFSGAALLDSKLRTLWPGPSFGCGLGMLLCCRFISAFDGMATGRTVENRYLEIFSLPLVEFTFLMYGFMYLLGVMGGLDGVLIPGLAWRRSVRYITLTVVLLFTLFLGYALGVKGMLTPSVIALELVMIIAGIVGTVEAANAEPLPVGQEVPPWARPPPVAWGRQPVVWGRPGSVPPVVWGRQGGGQPVRPPPQAQARAPRLRELRHTIPSPYEMLGEKSKRV